MMESKILEKLKFENREEVVGFLKRLITEKETKCPICKIGTLEHFHKKAKKSNTDWICKNCNERFKVIDIMDELN